MLVREPQRRQDLLSAQVSRSLLARCRCPRRALLSLRREQRRINGDNDEYECHTNGNYRSVLVRPLDIHNMATMQLMVQRCRCYDVVPKALILTHQSPRCCQDRRRQLVPGVLQPEERKSASRLAG